MQKPSLESTVIVTVTYNSGKHLQHFLESVRAAEGEPLEVVIADNGSTDIEGEREIASRFDAQFLELNENRGYGAAINAAVHASHTDASAYLICNPDLIVDPGAIAQLVKSLAQRSDAGSVGPRIANSDGSIYPSARNLPSLRNGLGHAVFSNIWPSNPWTRRYQLSLPTTGDPQSVGWLSGSCLLVRRRAFDDLQGFDEGYFMYFEDVDLGRRMQSRGWANLYDPMARVIHTGAHSTQSNSAAMLRAHHQSAYRYLERKYPGRLLAPLRWALRLGLQVRASYLIRGRDQDR
jgi:N-acetylglucosaminyl-diphospho-decaprenol L-rhamnosyltransferase